MDSSHVQEQQKKNSEMALSWKDLGSLSCTPSSLPLVISPEIN